MAVTPLQSMGEMARIHMRDSFKDEFGPHLVLVR